MLRGILRAHGYCSAPTCSRKHALARGEWSIPCYIYIDEAHTYIANDSNVPTLLDEVRKYTVGITIAHQRINQLSESVVDALYHDVGTILASRVRAPKLLASAMHCDPSVIENCRQGIEFALYIEDQIKPARPVRIPASVLENMPKRPHTPRPIYTAPEEGEYAAGAAPPPTPPPPPPAPDYGPVFSAINETLTSIRETLRAMPEMFEKMFDRKFDERMADYDLKPKPTIDQPGTALVPLRPVRDVDPETGETEAPRRRTQRGRRAKKRRTDEGWSSKP